jgi:hypothetical protein
LLLEYGYDPTALREEGVLTVDILIREGFRLEPPCEPEQRPGLYEPRQPQPQTDRAKAYDEREKEEMRMTRAAFTELERYLDAIGIPIATIENEIVTRSEEILNES